MTKKIEKIGVTEAELAVLLDHKDCADLLPKYSVWNFLV